MKNLIKLFWIFMIGSVMGCIVEEVWCLIKNKRFQIRKSLIYGPMIPIYGLAAVFIVVIADGVDYDLTKVFILGMIVSTTIEYLSSYIQEKIFHTKSWDYSGIPFNINGRVNLLYSIAFGLFSVFFVKHLGLFKNLLFVSSNENVAMLVTLVVFVFFSLDVILSVLATYRQKKRRKGIKAKNKIEEAIDLKYPDERLEKIYNNSVYIG